MRPSVRKATLVGWISSVVLLAGTALALNGQEALRPSAVYGEGSDFLFGIRGGSATGDAVAILTEPEPAVHLLSPDQSESWGREGGGPAELRDPADIDWKGRAILVLDMGNRKLVHFDQAGGFRSSRSLEGIWAHTIDVVAGDTVLGTFVPMTDMRAVIRLAGERRDTLFAYRSRGEDRRLEAQGAPSLTVKPPFSEQVQWTVRQGGGLARYDPSTGRIVFQDRSGTVTDQLEVPFEGTPVAKADVDWWIANAIPSDFKGRRVFEPLRPVAREELDFPAKLAPVLELEDHPAGGVWVKRSLESTGERWALLSAAGSVDGELRLRPGRRVVAFSGSHLFAVATDELGVETVEAYTLPGWARTVGS